MKNFINLFESTVSGSDEIIYHLCQSVFTHTQTKHWTQKKQEKHTHAHKTLNTTKKKQEKKHSCTHTQTKHWTQRKAWKHKHAHDHTQTKRYAKRETGGKCNFF